MLAQALGAWREGRARHIDRPRRRVLSDEVIVDLARQRPTSVQAMERLRALEPDVRKRHGAELVDLVRAAAGSPPGEWPASLDRGPAAPVEPALVDALAAVLSVCGRAADVSPRVLSSRGDLEKVAAGEDDVPVLRGWRATLAGDALRAFLAGRLRLEVQAGELQLADGGGDGEPRP